MALGTVTGGNITTMKKIPSNKPQKNIKTALNGQQNELLLSETVDYYQIFDQSGKLVKSGRLTEQKIEVGALPAGVYIIKLEYKGSTQTTKFILK